MQAASKPARQVASGARKTVRERAGWWGNQEKLNAWYGPSRNKVFGEWPPLISCRSREALHVL